MLRNKQIEKSGRSPRMMRLLALLVIATLTCCVGRSYGQSVAIEVYPYNCDELNDGPCCYNIRCDDWSGGTKTFNFSFDNTSCWDWDCFYAQFPSGSQTFTIGLVTYTATLTGSGTGPFTITFNPALPGSSGSNFSFHMCPIKDCDVVGSGFTWETWDEGVPPIDPKKLASAKQYFPGCADTGPVCQDYCDYTSVEVTYCDVNICFKKRGDYPGSSVGPFTVHFNPPWNHGDCEARPGCNASPTVPSGWSIGTVASGFVSSFTVTPPLGVGLNHCDGFCVTIPRCDPTHGGSAIWITDNSEPSKACSPHPTAMLKEVHEKDRMGLAETQPNYPNPLTKNTDFSTTIPFNIIGNGGDAKINIFDRTGKVIHSDIASFTGAGKHFFYFTAKDVPSGTYTYTIESPLGVKIVEHKLLIIK